MSTITIASFTSKNVGDSDFYDKLNSSLQSTKRDCFTLHENPSLIDLLPGFIIRLKRKENSLKTIYLFFWITLIDSVAISQSYRCSGILTWFPFACFFYNKVFNLSLRIDSPIFNYCFYGTFLHFSLQVLFCHLNDDALTWIFATTTKICTNHNFIEHHCSISTLWSHLSTVENLLCLSSSQKRNSIVLNSQSKSTISASSIFRTNSFGRWVITHSLADFDFHDHRPTVSMN
jgi:hypothetical protein